MNHNYKHVSSKGRPIKNGLFWYPPAMKCFFFFTIDISKKNKSSPKGFRHEEKPDTKKTICPPPVSVQNLTLPIFV